MLDCLVKAPLAFFTTIDSGKIINQFSQDIGIIDDELSIALLTLLLTMFIALSQTVLIIVSSPWLRLAFIFIIPTFCVVQVFYLGSSRQLRNMELEAKGPLYTSFAEMLGSLSTLRAFG